MKTFNAFALTGFALFVCWQAVSIVAPHDVDQPGQLNASVQGKSPREVSAPARSSTAPMAAYRPGSFGDLAQVFQVVAPPAAVAANSPAPALPGNVAYGRPDLSADPNERKLGEQMQVAIAKGDFAGAQALALTQSLREFYVKHQRAHAEAIQADMIASLADTAKPGQREP